MTTTTIMTILFVHVIVTVIVVNVITSAFRRCRDQVYVPLRYY